MKVLKFISNEIIDDIRDAFSNVDIDIASNWLDSSPFDFIGNDYSLYVKLYTTEKEGIIFTVNRNTKIDKVLENDVPNYELNSYAKFLSFSRIDAFPLFIVPNDFDITNSNPYLKHDTEQIGALK
jgi:hypothetical protein